MIHQIVRGLTELLIDILALIAEASDFGFGCEVLLGQKLGLILFSWLGIGYYVSLSLAHGNATNHVERTLWAWVRSWALLSSAGTSVHFWSTSVLGRIGCRCIPPRDHSVRKNF